MNTILVFLNGKSTSLYYDCVQCIIYNNIFIDAGVKHMLGIYLYIKSYVINATNFFKYFSFYWMIILVWHKGIANLIHIKKKK